MVIDSTGLAAAVWIEGGYHGIARAAFSDGVAPTASITTPPDGATYEQGAAVPADYACADNLPGQLVSCSAPVQDGSAIPTGTAGAASFAVTATDRAGNNTTTTHAYTVEAALPPTITGVDEVADPVARYGRFEAAIELERDVRQPVRPGPDRRRRHVHARRRGATRSCRRSGTSRSPPRARTGRSTRRPARPAGACASRPTRSARTPTRSPRRRAHGSAAPVDGSFQATASTADGFVRIDDRNGRYLRFDSGDPYVPVGHNAAFEDGNPNLNGVGYYSNLFGSLGRAGENWSRVWMTDFNRSALEWGEGHYSGFYHGPASTRSRRPGGWTACSSSPSRTASRCRWCSTTTASSRTGSTTAGRVRCDPADPPPCEPGDQGYDPGNALQRRQRRAGRRRARPDLFFADPDARDLMKKRLRYIVARYGALPALLAWELFNEVQFVGTERDEPRSRAPELRGDIVDWHADMAAIPEVERSLRPPRDDELGDPRHGRHLGLNAVWSLPGDRPRADPLVRAPAPS